MKRTFISQYISMPAAIVLGMLPLWAQSPQPSSQSAANHIRFDLTVALKTPLVTSAYEDDGVTVDAELDRKIVTLPFALKPFATLDRELMLGGNTIRIEPATGKKKPRFIGFRILSLRDGKPDPRAASSGAVYEKITISPSRRGGARFEAANTKRPPGGGKSATRAKPKIPDAGRRGPPALTASDGLALLVDVDGAATAIDVALAKEPTEHIGVAYLADAATATKLSERSTANDPKIKTTLDVASGPNGAMAALALGRLAQWRDGFDPKTPRPLMTAIAERLAAGLAHADDRARSAAWDAFVLGPKFSDLDRAALGAAGTDSHVAIATCAARDLSAAVRQSRINLLDALNAAWRGADRALADRVIDIVAAHPSPDVFDILDGATPAGLDALLSRVRTESRVVVRAGLLRALIGQTPVEMEPALLSEARKLHLEIVDPADPIFKRFTEANDPKTRVSILKSLEVVSAEAIHHTQPFAQFVDTATGPRQDATVREAGFRMVVAQAGMTAPPRDRQPHAAFPLTSPGGLDGLTPGLARAASTGSPQTQIDALALLILRGEPRAAVEAIRATKPTPDGLAATLGKLRLRDGIAQSDGMFAFLVLAIGQVDRTMLPVLFRKLDDLAASYPQGARWRLSAAVRCGVDWNKFIALSTDRDPVVAAAAMRWLAIAAHLGKEESGAIAAGKRAKDRAAALAKINADRSRRIAGRYGCLLVVEFVEPLDPIRFGAAPVPRWSAPRRANLFGPIVAIQDAGDQFVLAAAGDAIGGGRPVRLDAKLPDAKAWPPTLALATWKMPGVGDDRTGSPMLYAPLVLAGGTLLSEGAEGALNIDAIQLIRAGLANAGDEPLAGLAKCLPEALRLTLRPTGFGTLVGAAPSNPPAGKNAAMLNVLVILEPLE